MPESSTEPQTVNCPICGREVFLADPLSPFCSESCRSVDLGNWASERYTIASRVADESAEAADLLEERPEGED